jgi:endonuclease/exonuclease/phosphatase family metal-dependent hydrolase
MPEDNARAGIAVPGGAVFTPAPPPAHVPNVARPTPVAPYLAELLAAPASRPEAPLDDRLTVASYNVHRWAGVRGGRAFRPERSFEVIDELGADVLALQEVLRPTTREDPLRAVAERLGYHLAFVVTRMHKRGELGNAVLSRWPLDGALAIDLSFGRLERRAALAVRLRGGDRHVTVAATHLALVDRTRARQVRALLGHPQLAAGPAVLVGDMNAWRPSRASRDLDTAFRTRHHNDAWPASYPSVRPVLALDRLYARGARVLSLRAHESAAARRGSDHLPIVAHLALADGAEQEAPPLVKEETV